MRMTSRTTPGRRCGSWKKSPSGTGISWTARLQSSLSTTSRRLETYDVRIRAVSPDGYASDWSEDDVQVLGKIAPPQDIATLSATVREGGIEIAWSAVADKDLSHYVLKVGADWEAWIDYFRGLHLHPFLPLERPDPPTTYHLMVKAVDTSGNESLTEADHDAVITAFPGVAPEPHVSGCRKQCPRRLDGTNNREPAGRRIPGTQGGNLRRGYPDRNRLREVLHDSGGFDRREYLLDSGSGISRGIPGQSPRSTRP